MYDTFIGLTQRLTEQQKVLWGAVGILVGTVLIAILTFGGISSISVQVLLGIAGVFFAVLGTILLGTSEERDQMV